MEKIAAEKPKYNVQEFEFLDLKETDVYVFLGYKVHPSFPSREYTFRADLEVKKFAHQTAGVACHHVYLHGLFLPIKQEFYKKFLQWHFDHENLGVFGSSLSEVEEYASFIRPLGLDCQNDYKSLEESLYPIDTRECSKLVDFELPENLDDLMVFDGPIDKMGGMVGRWRCYVVCHNSD